jgi:Methyltransferase FkbM domain
MQTLGHEWVDVVKMDVDGSEFDALGYLGNLPGDAMRFTQLLLEVHLTKTGHFQRRNAIQLNLLRNLLSHGFRTTAVEPNIYYGGKTCDEVSLIKTDNCGNIVTLPL